MSTSDATRSRPRTEEGRRPRRGATMGDIAERVGVSRTTVSFVLNDRPDAGIPDETRRRVIDAAAERLWLPPECGGPGPRGAPERLVRDRDGDRHRAVRGRRDREARRTARSSEGKFLLITSSEPEVATEAAGIEKLLDSGSRGSSTPQPGTERSSVPDVVREVPTVLVNCFDAEGSLPAVVPDEVGGGRRATQRLLDAGHTRIGFITLDPAIPASVGRRQGYDEALAAAGVPEDPSLVVAGDATADGGYAAAGELLDRADRPTAIFCGNDRMAMGAYDAIKERGLAIPHDVAVVGFDNQELIAAYLRPRLDHQLPFPSRRWALAASTCSPRSQRGSRSARRP